MRKALVVGIDHYSKIGRLHGCVRDAAAVAELLDRHEDASNNFEVERLASTSQRGVRRTDLREKIRELFKGDDEIALLFFAGHGFVDDTGGYLLTSECETGDDGVALSEVLTLANKSEARNRIVILDSCHSGAAGNSTNSPELAELRTGMTVLAASTAEQYATEEHGHGVFTALMLDALGGAAANLAGEVTVGSIYAHIDQSLGAWEQRPVFKANVKKFFSLRRVKARITIEELRRLTVFFPEAGAEFKLDPSFEPDSERITKKKPDPAHMEQFAVLQRLNRVDLVVPVGETHMYYAAMNSKSCTLTPLGEHYRRLVARRRI